MNYWYAWLKAGKGRQVRFGLEGNRIWRSEFLEGVCLPCPSPPCLPGSSKGPAASLQQSRRRGFQMDIPQSRLQPAREAHYQCLGLWAPRPAWQPLADGEM